MATLSGRVVNFMSRRLPGLASWGTRRQVDQFRSSGGTKGNDLMGKPVFLLDVIGRSSGELRPVMLMLAERGDDIVVIGSNGGNPVAPNWYKNLMAAGSAQIQVGADSWSVTPRQLDDGPERDECWAIAAAAYPDFDSYQELTDRKIPVVLLERKAG